MDRIVDCSNAQEPVHLHFPGDTLFTPFERRRGLPIGNLTSQFFANLYLDRFDHFVTEVLRAPYVRYVDDFALFHDDPDVLREWRARIAQFLEGRRLKLHPRKTAVLKAKEPAPFLGFVLSEEGRRLPDDNVWRFRNRLRGLRGRWRVGSASARQVEARVMAWIAHASHAKSWRLRRAMFAGGWFDPARRAYPGVASRAAEAFSDFGLAHPVEIVRYSYLPRHETQPAFASAQRCVDGRHLHQWLPRLGNDKRLALGGLLDEARQMGLGVVDIYDFHRARPSELIGLSPT